MRRSPPPAGDVSIATPSVPPPRLSNPYAQNGTVDPKTPVDTVGYYEKMGYDGAESPAPPARSFQKQLESNGPSRVTSITGEPLSRAKSSPFMQQLSGDSSISPVYPVRGATNADDPYGYMEMIGNGPQNNGSPPFQRPPDGEYQVPGYPDRSFRDPMIIREQEPEIPSLNLPLVPELDHRNFDHVKALETVPPFNPKWVDPQPLLDWILPPKAPRRLDRPNIPGQKSHTGKGGKAGVGLAVSPDKDGEWVVSSVHPNGPSAQTGMIEAGDTIKAVNGVILKGYPRQSVIDVMTGPPATQAVMLVEKKKAPNVITVFVSRAMLGEGEPQQEGEEEEDNLYAHPRYEEREESPEEREARLELENVELRKRLARLKGQEPAEGETRPASMMAKIKSWGWDLTTLTKKPADYQEEELQVLELPSSLQPVGFLDVEVIEARNLPRVDVLGQADPYVRVLCHGQLATTDKKLNTLHPHWAEILAVNIFDPRHTLQAHKLKIPDQMRVQLCSWKSSGKDETIGSVLFSTSELCGGLDERGVGEGWYDVQRQRATGGMEAVKATHSQSPCQIYLRFTYTKVPLEYRNTVGATPSVGPV